MVGAEGLHECSPLPPIYGCTFGLIPAKSRSYIAIRIPTVIKMVDLSVRGLKI